MRAVVYTRYGPPEILQLRDLPKPIPRDNEVLIRIHATTVNRTDCGFRRPEYGWIIRPIHGLFRPGKNILGSELSGVVEATGRDVTAFTAGEEVFGLTNSSFGAHAEYICLPEDGSIARKPVNISFEDAAGVCDGLMLAWTFIKSINFERSRTILITGATGSIGSACLQLARHYGAAITAVCRGESSDFVKALGAERVIDYTREDFTRDSQTYDVVIDAVGRSSFFRCKRLLRRGGVYFSTDLGFLAQNAFLPLLAPIFSSRRVRFPIPKVTSADIQFFRQLIEAGQYKPVVDRKYRLDQIVEATKYVESGQKIGNVVLTVREIPR